MRWQPTLALLFVAAVATGGSAQSRHDSSAPIDFSAAHQEFDDRAKRVVLSGDVVVRQSEMTLAAARMSIAYSGDIFGGATPQASRVDASGGVTLTRPDQTARSQYAIYDLNRRVVTMIGNVSLRQSNGNVINGGRLTFNLDTNRATIDGSSAAPRAPGVTEAAPGGRVTGRFSVPKRDDK